MSEPEFHPVSGIFPLMEEKAFIDLVNDIRLHGLREPIWMYECKILDGRNRFRACVEAGVHPLFRDYEGDDPVGFVVSLNLHRRHLNESQRAMAAAEIWDCQHGGNRTDQESNSTLADVTRQLSVGKTAVKEARKVTVNGIPELTSKVKSGEIRVSTAADIATLPANQQDIIVGLGEKAILMAAKEIRQKKASERREANERIRQQALAIPPPDGQYRCIVIDPPWPMQKIIVDKDESTPELDYPVMTLEQIMAMDLPAADQCHLYLWTTQRFIWAAKDLLETWGFKHLAVMVWHKAGGYQPIGLPAYNCEFILLGRKGGLEFTTTRQFPLCFEAPRREHSRKPDEFYDLVRRVSPGPRIDMFSREHRDGYAQFGAETDAFL